jgi:hypothetical protein
MKWRVKCAGIAVLCVLALGWAGIIAWAQKTNEPKKKLAISIKPKDVADALYAVVASDREVYVRQLAAATSVQGMANPCERFRLSSQATASKGVEFSYVLRSLHPSRTRNAPETDLEKNGLAHVASHPNDPYYGEEMQGGRWYFTAVYADVAFHNSCAACHNQLKDSPKKDYKTGDVLGGVVVRVALEL